MLIQITFNTKVYGRYDYQRNRETKRLCVLLKLQVIITCYILDLMNFAEGTVLTSFTTRVIII